MKLKYFIDLMLEITGDIFDRDSWSYKPTTPEIALCVTTNGAIKANGQAVMGAGMAKAFTIIYPQLPVILGQRLACRGNQVHYLLTQNNVHILSFPTKHHWRDSSDLSLIENSARTLAELAILKPYCTFILTRPGCGLGCLSWSALTLHTVFNRGILGSQKKLTLTDSHQPR